MSAPMEIKEVPEFDVVLNQDEERAKVEMKDEPIVVKQLSVFTARQVFDEMSRLMEKVECLDELPKDIDESIQLQSLLAGNSSIDQVMLLTRDLGNVPVMIYECDELLSFDPRGELVMPGIDVLGCLWIPDELSKGSTSLISETNSRMRLLSSLQKSLDPREEVMRAAIKPFLEGHRFDGMLLMNFVLTEFSCASLIPLDYTKPLVDAFDCVDTLIFDPGGGAWSLGGEFLNLEHFSRELQLSDEMMIDITTLFGACLSSIDVKQLILFALELGKVEGCLSGTLSLFGFQQLVF